MIRRWSYGADSASAKTFKSFFQVQLHSDNYCNGFPHIIFRRLCKQSIPLLFQGCSFVFSFNPIQRDRYKNAFNTVIRKNKRTTIIDVGIFSLSMICQSYSQKHKSEFSNNCSNFLPHDLSFTICQLLPVFHHLSFTICHLHNMNI
jgi:hypothetical protein